MALRLFKKKDGSPTGLAKIAKGIGKVAAKVVPFLPVPAGIANTASKALDKLSEKTGISTDALKVKKDETVGEVLNRVSVGAGAATAAFVDNADKPTQSKNPLIFGFAKEKVLKTAPLILLGVAGLYWGLKKLRIL